MKGRMCGWVRCRCGTSWRWGCMCCDGNVHCTYTCQVPVRSLALLVGSSLFIVVDEEACWMDIYLLDSSAHSANDAGMYSVLMLHICLVTLFLLTRSPVMLRIEQNPQPRPRLSVVSLPFFFSLIVAFLFHLLVVLLLFPFTTLLPSNSLPTTDILSFSLLPDRYR